MWFFVGICERYLYGRDRMLKKRSRSRRDVLESFSSYWLECTKPSVDMDNREVSNIIRCVIVVKIIILFY